MQPSVPGVRQTGNSTGMLYGAPKAAPASPVIQGSTPNLQPTWNPQGGNLGVLSTFTDSPVVDYGPTAEQIYQQQAAQAEASRVSNLMAGFNNQKSNIYGSANDAATSLQGGFNQSILDTIRGFTRNQDAIDKKSVQNESSKIQGGRDIMSMVGRGVKSGGVQLAQKNAGSSSATQAIANAYGQLGQRQMSTIGNQYASNAGDIADTQRYQNEDLASAPGKFHEGLMQSVNGIVNAARDQFAALDAAMANASLPDRIAIEQEKETLRGQVLGHLQQYDAQLAQGVGGIKALGGDDVRSRANSQLSAGQADPNLFNYNTQVPAQFQNSGPFASELPIFTYKNKQQFA